MVADALADHFGRQSSFGEYPEAFRKKHTDPSSKILAFQVPPDKNDCFNKPFSMAELEFALRKGKGKSAGPDEMGYPMIKNLPPSGKIALLAAINKEFADGTFPAEWRSSLVVPIPKQNGQANDASGYRPIALTNVGSKVMERLVNRRLVEYLESTGRLDNRQHAFRPGRGTNTYLASLTQILEDAKGKHTELISLDISKAYSRTWTPGVLEKLAHWGLSGNMLSFIKNFLLERTFQVQLGATTSKTTKEETGVPQGSVIAVTLFLVAMEEVFVDLPKEIFILVYADDILLVAVGKHPKVVRRKAQAAVNRVAKWAQSVGFQMAAGKCIRMHACQSNHRLPKQPITLDGSIIPTKNSVKLLGITFDRKLTFKQHFAAVRKACQARTNMVKLISKKRTRSDRPTRFRVADAVITSRLLYGIEATSGNFDDLISNLAPVYNRSIRLVSGLLPSTPADMACAEAGVLPFRHKATAALCTRTIGYLERTTNDNRPCCLLDRANEVLHRSTQQRLPKIAGLHRLGAASWNKAKPKIELSLKSKLKKNPNASLAQGLFQELLDNKHPTSTIRYTDGSKAAGTVGVGIHSYDGPCSSHRLPDLCSVFSAEAAAIFQAVIQPSTDPVLVVTDSASVLSAVASDSNRHPFVQAIQAALDTNTTLTWVPGHAGIRGNEEADILANTGRFSPFLSRVVPADDAKLWVKQSISLTWANEWRRQRNICRMIKNSILPGEDLPNRREQVVLSRLRTGHTMLTHNFGSGDFHHTCDTCHTRMTVNHVFNTCPLFQEPRTTNDVPNTITALQNDAIRERQTINFLKDCGLFNRI